MKFLAGERVPGQVQADEIELAVDIAAKGLRCAGPEAIYLFPDQRIDEARQEKPHRNGDSLNMGILFVLEGILQIAHDGGHPVKQSGIAVSFITNHKGKTQVFIFGTHKPEGKLVFVGQGVVTAYFLDDFQQDISVCALFPQLLTNSVASVKLIGGVVELDRIRQLGIQIDVIVREHRREKRITLC